MVIREMVEGSHTLNGIRAKGPTSVPRFITGSVNAVAQTPSGVPSAVQVVVPDDGV